MPDEVSELRDKLQREHISSLQAIMAANEDLNTRLKDAKVSVFYDAEADLVMISFGVDGDTMTETIGNRVALRVEVDTLRIVGIDILGFASQVKTDARPMRVLLGAVKTPGATFDVFNGDPDALANGIRELVPA